jgi:hypothetical protein
MKNLNNNKLWTLSLFIMTALMLFSASVGTVQMLDARELVINDSVIYVPPFYYYSPDNLSKTYKDEYLLNAIMPMGYKVMNILAAKYYDIQKFNLYSGYILFLATMMIIFKCVRELSSNLIAITTIAFIISFSGSAFIGFGFSAGTPRMFCYPLVALTALGLIQCRPLLLGAVTIISTLFYPQAGLISGCAMALMLLLPKSYRSGMKDWNLFKRLIFILSVILISSALLLPQFLSSLEYGARITPSTVDEFPEAGEYGKYQPGDTLPHGFYYTWAMQVFNFTLSPNGNTFIDLEDSDLYAKLLTFFIIFVFVTIAVGMQQIVRKENEKIVRLFLLLASGLTLFTLAVILQPYLYMPKRYFMFTIPIAVTILLPIALVRLYNQNNFINRHQNLAQKLSVITILISIITFGGKGYTDIKDYDHKKNANPLKFTDSEKDLLNYIANLDKDSLIAGWYFDRITNQINYYSRRNVLCIRAGDEVLHEKYIENYRERMSAIREAYYTENVNNIINLKEKFGVTHIVINQTDYTEPPRELEFRKYEHEELFESKKDSAVLRDTKRLEDAILKTGGTYVLYDIDKVINILNSDAI